MAATSVFTVFKSIETRVSKHAMRLQRTAYYAHETKQQKKKRLGIEQKIHEESQHESSYGHGGEN